MKLWYKLWCVGRCLPLSSQTVGKPDAGHEYKVFDDEPEAVAYLEEMRRYGATVHFWELTEPIKAKG